MVEWSNSIDAAEILLGCHLQKRKKSELNQWVCWSHIASISMLTVAEFSFILPTKYGMLSARQKAKAPKKSEFERGGWIIKGLTLGFGEMSWALWV